MTTRERKEARLEKRLDWAEGRKEKAAEAFRMSDRAIDGIPFGQPILVGHHSEKRHRAALDKSWNAMGRGVDSLKMAEHHESKADGIQRQLDTSIYSDDPDAIEALTLKAEEIEAASARCKAINAAFRKIPGDDKAAKLVQLAKSGVMTDAEALDVARLFSLCPYEKQPYPGYHLTNMGAKARKARERIQIVKSRAEHIEKAEAAPGGVLIERGTGNNFCRVTFAKKPDREILDELRSAGYRWTGASWAGCLDKLPSVIE